MQALTRSVLTAFIFSAGLSLTTDARASAGACEAEILRAARVHGVPPGILHSVGLAETAARALSIPMR